MERIFQFQKLTLRAHLALTSMAAVASTMLVATYLFLEVVENHLIERGRERDRARAGHAVAVEVYSRQLPLSESTHLELDAESEGGDITTLENRLTPFPLPVLPFELPYLETGSVLQIVEGEGKLLYDSREATLKKVTAIPRRLVKVGRFTPHLMGLAEQRDFEVAAVAFDHCMNARETSAPSPLITADNIHDGEVQTPLSRTQEHCGKIYQAAFARAAKVFAAKAARNVILEAQDDNRYLRTDVTLLRPDGVTPVSAIVGTSLRDIDRRMRSLRNDLIIGAPLLVGLVGFISWLTARRSLQPVEKMRQEVLTIAHPTLDRRVPEPAVQDEIGLLARTMNTMLNRLEHAATAQRQFVSDASHELRGPLAGIRAQVEVALDHPRQEIWQAAATEIHRESLRMQKLIDELLELARMDEQAPEVYVGAKRLIDLDDLVFAEAKRAQGPTVSLSNVSAGRVRGNPDQLRRMLRNLLENAARYAHSQIRLGLTTERDHVILTVEDDGPGVPEEQRERIFERFARVDGDRNRTTGGIGLGLAVAKGIVTRHDGQIAVDEAPLGGARFTVTLPAAE